MEPFVIISPSSSFSTANITTGASSSMVVGSSDVTQNQQPVPPPTPSAHSSAPSAGPKPTTARACNECRRRKGRCIGGNPGSCHHCYERHMECTWAPEDGRRHLHRDLYGALKVQNYTLEARNHALQLQVEALEQALRQRGSPLPSPPHPSDVTIPGTSPSSSQNGTSQLPTSPLAGNAVGPEAKGEADQDLSEDFGRLVIEHGGFFGDISAFHFHPPTNQHAVHPLSPVVQPSMSPARYRLYTSDTDPNILTDPCSHDLYLPPFPHLTRATHDLLIDRFIKFYAFWCLRVVPDALLRDMYIALSHPDSSLFSPFSSGDSTLGGGYPHGIDMHFGDPVHSLPQTHYYSPLLHNAIIAMALMYSDDPNWRLESTRMVFARVAVGYVEADADHPTLATVLGLAILSSFYSALGKQGLGFMYFGLSIRMAQALGLNVNCSAWVQKGYITHEHMMERNMTYWCSYTQDTCWATYVGRESSMPLNQNRIPIPDVDPAMDEMIQEWPARVVTPDPGIELATYGEGADDEDDEDLGPTIIPARSEPCLISTSFVATCKLLKILGTQIFDLLYGIGKDPTRCKTAAIGDVRVALGEWLNELPESLKLNRKISKTVAPPAVLMVHLAYWWVMILLHRPLFRNSANSTNNQNSTATTSQAGGLGTDATPVPLAPPPQGTSTATAPAEDPLKLCDRSVSKIMELLDVWKRLYGLRFCPVTLVQIIFTAGVTALVVAAARRKQDKLHKKALAQANLCVAHLNEMAVAWQSASQNGAILQSLVEQHCWEETVTGGKTRPKRTLGGRGTRGHIVTAPHGRTRRRSSSSKKPRMTPSKMFVSQSIGEPSNPFGGVPSPSTGETFASAGLHSGLGLTTGVAAVHNNSNFVLQGPGMTSYPPIRSATPTHGLHLATFRAASSGTEFDIRVLNDLVQGTTLFGGNPGMSGFADHPAMPEEVQHVVMMEKDDVEGLPVPEGFDEFERQYEATLGNGFSQVAGMRSGEGFPDEPATVGLDDGWTHLMTDPSHNY